MSCLVREWFVSTVLQITFAIALYKGESQTSLVLHTGVLAVHDILIGGNIVADISTPGVLLHHQTTC